MRPLLFNIILIGLLMQANCVWPQIYQYSDDKGHITYSDRPSAGAKLLALTNKTYRYKHRVKRVVDGDTIIIESGERLRLLGLNAPEVDSYYRQGEVGGKQAKQWLENMLQQQTIFIEYDRQQRDKYQRLLVHVFLINGEHINRQLIALGLASLTIIPPNLRYADELIAAQNKAEQANLGIWALEHYQSLSINELTTPNEIKGWHRFNAVVRQINYSQKYIRLVLTDNVDIRIAKQNAALFADLDNYIGKKLEIRGWASRTKQHYSIVVHHPSAIIVQ